MEKKMSANNDITQLILGGMGRPFTLGMLYNAPKDQLVPGIALWDSGTLKSITDKRPQNSSNFEITASDSTKSSTFNLNVDASLKLSFMSGLVKVGGSANYLNDQKELKSQSRVILNYNATTHFEQLCLTAEVCQKIQNLGIIEKGLATHVVTGIEYGANAFFVFDSEKVDSSQVQDIKGQMTAVIKKIPQCDIDGKADLHLTEEEKKLVQTFTVKFYGDFLLESNPATFDAAVTTYVNLPKLMRGPQGTQEPFPVNTVPLRIWVLPLNIFHAKSAQKVKGISVGLVIEAENTLEDLANVQMRCNDSLSNSAVGKFPPLQHQLTTFNRLCHYYTVELQRQMAEKCPAIREGKEKESALRQIFDDREESPFKQVTLSTWLDNKEREVNVILSCLSLIKNVPVLSTQSEIDKFVLTVAPGGNCTGYIFNWLETIDVLLEDMKNYLSALKQGKVYVPSKMKSIDPIWFNNKDVVINMRATAATFDQSKDPSRFVAAIQNPNSQQGATIYTYKNSFPENTNVASSSDKMKRMK